MKLSGTQLFVLALGGMLLLAATAYLDRTYVPVLVSVVLSVLGVAVHINGVNTGVPLSPPATALPVATLESTSVPASAASPGLPPAMPSVANGVPQA